MKTWTFVFVFVFGQSVEPVKPSKVDRARCPHVSVYKDPDILGEMTSRIVCEKCGKEWTYPGSSYLERRDPKALEQKRIYELMENRAEGK